jgi:hypothetical protein
VLVTVDTANTVPVSWANVGLLFAVSVAAAQGGGPAVNVGAGVTACQAPTPPLAAWLNHSNELPVPRSQFATVSDVNAFPVDTSTSK